MNLIKRFLSGVLCVLPLAAWSDGPVATTAGNNLTAFNNNNSMSNNNWAIMTNPRILATAENSTTATADFGNCNAVIMRCAQPKCSGTGCADPSVAAMIVSGCVAANKSCAQYDADGALTNYIVAQLVASSTDKANQAALAAQSSAATAAAQESAQQLQQMQYQMQQMQSEMAAQNAQTVSQLQSALAAQQQMTEDALARMSQTSSVQEGAPVNNDSAVTGISAAQQAAAAAGVSEDIIAREKISGQIMSGIENSEIALKTVKETMKNAFDYARCDQTGSNCSAPKRVKTFKDKASQFFDPYNNVLDELYDALITAQAVGVDITDIYMMLNDSCNVWGQYLCSQRPGKVAQSYTDTKGEPQTKLVDGYVMYSTYNSDNCSDNRSVSVGDTVGGHECYDGMVIPPEDDRRCTLQKTLTNADEVQRQWLFADQGDLGDNVRVGCASSALQTSVLFRNRKRASSVDIDTLQRMITQDSPSSCYSKNGEGGSGCVNWCNAKGDTATLEKYTMTKTLDKEICLSGKPDDNNTGVACKENTPYIIPMLTMCSTHVYNFGRTENVSATERAELDNILALKTTVVAQQMYKQYEYLESMIRRFKTQLEKAVLTTKLQVASGAASGGSSSASSGGSNTSSSSVQRERNVYLSDARDCNEEFTLEKSVECLQSNYNAIKSESNNGMKLSSELKKQLANDYQLTIGLQKQMNNCTGVRTDQCQTSSTKAFQTCMSNLMSNIRALNVCLTNSKNTQQRWNQNN